MVRKERHEISSPRASRRRVLSSIAGVGVSSLLASVASTAVGATDGKSPDGESLDADSLPTESSDSVSDDLVGEVADILSLGDFESGLDGWDADGKDADSDLDLVRVDRSDRPVAVTEGERALEVAVEGAPSPAIARPVGALNLAAHPYFLADVTPGRVAGTDAPVAFQFRLYRPLDLLDGNTDDRELVAESDPVTVRQAAPGRIFWDASDVDAGLLDAVSLLEIGWAPVDQDSSADFDYRGSVVFDAVRATDSADAVGSARLAATMRDLQFEHGPYERTEVTAESETAESETVEEGAFVFADGATEPYRFEVLAEDRFRLTVGETAVKLGGGWSGDSWSGDSWSRDEWSGDGWSGGGWR